MFVLVMKGERVRVEEKLCVGELCGVDEGEGELETVGLGWYGKEALPVAARLDERVGDGTHVGDEISSKNVPFP